MSPNVAVDESREAISGHKVKASVELCIAKNYEAANPTVFYVSEEGVTDANGKFTFSGLPTNVPISFYCDDLLDNDPNTVHGIADVLLKPSEARVGAVEIVRRTPLDSIPKPIHERFAKVIRNAKLGSFHTLVIVRDRQVETSEAFVNEYFRFAGRVAEIDRYIELAVDSTTSDESELAFMKQKNWPVQRANEVFVVVYNLDGEEIGRAVYDTTKASASDDAGLFIKEHAPATQDAKVKWDQAFELAQQTKRRVWIRMSGNHCSPCFALSRWIDDNRAVLDKDFVLLKIDGYLDQHGKEIGEKLSSGRMVGIPFHAMFDSDGKLIIDSYGPLGNIGFMSSHEGKLHFRKMLESSCANLTKTEIDSLLSTLDAQTPE